MSKHKPKPTKSIKEYIYVDNLEVNSILAQFEDGIPKVIEEIKQSTETNTEGTSGKMSSSATGGFNAGAKGEATFKGEMGTNNSDTNSEMYQEAISTVYHDYAVNIMTDELDNANLLKTTTKQPEGTFVQLTSRFELVDPIAISSRLDDKTISFMLSLDNESDNSEIKNAKEGFRLITQFGSLLNKLFPESILVSTNNALTIAEKSNFRMNESQLKALILAKRKITVLGKIESIISEDNLDTDLITSNIVQNPSSFSTLMSQLGFFALSSFDLIKKDDRLIKPIAIYFE